MKRIVVLAGLSLFGLTLSLGSGAAPKRRSQQCYIEVHTNLFGNPAIPCEYRFTALVNGDGTITSSGGGTRFCEGNGFFGLGAGNGNVGTPSSILFPNIADIRFDLPQRKDEGQWVLDLVQSLSDRAGSSPVTSSQMICADATR